MPRLSPPSLPNFSRIRWMGVCQWVLLLLLGGASVFAQDACWKNSYSRGFGATLGNCDPASPKTDGEDGCFPPCKAGYEGTSFVCWQECPPSFRTDGAFCFKPKGYERGTGYPWKAGDSSGSLEEAEARCRRDHGECEKSGEVFFPQCKAGYHAVGCCMCSPDCPAGMSDIGNSCAKDSYVRAKAPPSCPAGMEKSGERCFPACKPGFTGIGSLCVAECPQDRPVNCGASCARSPEECASLPARQVVSFLDGFSQIAMTLASRGGNHSRAKVLSKAEEGVLRFTALQWVQTLKHLSAETLRRELRFLRNQWKARQSESKKRSQETVEILDQDIAQWVEAWEQGMRKEDPLEVLRTLEPGKMISLLQAHAAPACSEALEQSTRRALPLVEIPKYRDELGRDNPPMPPSLMPPRGTHPGRHLFQENKCIGSLEFGYFAEGSQTWSMEKKQSLCRNTRDSNRVIGCYNYKVGEGLSSDLAIQYCRDSRYLAPPPSKPKPKKAPVAKPVEAPVKKTPAPPKPSKPELGPDPVVRPVVREEVEPVLTFQKDLGPVSTPPPPTTEYQKCIQLLGTGTISWGGGTRWNQANSRKLCTGVQDTQRVMNCFQTRIRSRIHWRNAIADCHGQ